MQPSSDESISSLALTRRRIGEAVTPIMFFLAVLYLAIVAVLIVIWVGMQRMDESSGGLPVDAPVMRGADVQDYTLENAALAWSEWGIGLLAFIWPVFIAEFLIQFILRDRGDPFWRYRSFWILICICPPLRMCARNPDVDAKIWLPVDGWCEVNESLRDRLERTFAMPMIVIALMILPVLALEFGLSKQVNEYTWLRVVLYASTGLIWFAFAAEFILMLSVADKKLRYCREHWIDLAIILLPVVSFLRSLRIVRALQVAKFAKVQQITRMGRLYRLRGLAMRAFRAILVLELLDRVIHVDPEKRLARFQSQLKEKEKEADDLRVMIVKIEKEIEELKELKKAADEQ